MPDYTPESEGLPPTNPEAHGLRLSSVQLKGIMLWLGQNPEAIAGAWIFGSRYSGVRTPKEIATASDIDLAVEVVPCDEDELGLWFFELRERLRNFIAENGASYDLNVNSGCLDCINLEIVRKGSTVDGYLKAGALQIFP